MLLPILPITAVKTGGAATAACGWGLLRGACLLKPCLGEVTASECKEGADSGVLFKATDEFPLSYATVQVCENWVPRI